MAILANMPAFAVALIAFLSLGLTACDTVTQMGGPTLRFVIKADAEELDRAGQSDAEKAAVIEESMAVIRQRIELSGGYAHSMVETGEGRIVIETSQIESPEFSQLIRARGRLAIRLVDEDADMFQLEDGIAPPGTEILPMTQGYGLLAVKRIGGISGNSVTLARAQPDQMTGEPVVLIEFNERAGDRFGQMTTNNVGRRLAIVIDDEVVSAPQVLEPILGGSVQISGGFTQEEAEQLAIRLQTGALPVPFEFLAENVIE